MKNVVSAFDSGREQLIGQGAGRQQQPSSSPSLVTTSTPTARKSTSRLGSRQKRFQGIYCRKRFANCGTKIVVNADMKPEAGPRRHRARRCPGPPYHRSAKNLSALPKTPSLATSALELPTLHGQVT
jgi:hypothetical protein